MHRFYFPRFVRQIYQCINSNTCIHRRTNKLNVDMFNPEQFHIVNSTLIIAIIQVTHLHKHGQFLKTLNTQV